MKIKTGLKIVVAVSVAIIAAAMGTSFVAGRQVREMAQEEMSFGQVLEKISGLRALTYDFLMYRTDRARNQWWLTHHDLEGLLAAPQFRASSREEAFDDLRTRHSSVRLIFEQLLQTHEKKATSPKLEPVLKEVENRLAGQMLIETQKMVSDIFQLSSALAQRSRNTVRLADLINTGAWILVLSIILMNSGYIFSSVIKPLFRLHKGIEIVGAGNLNHRVAIELQNEIGDLSRTFDHMTDQLQRTTVSRDELIQEVEERRRVEEELRRNREWLRVTLSSIGDAVIATDASGMITFLNPVGAELTGWQVEHALGQPIRSVFQIISEKTGEPAENIVERVLREGRVISLANHTALLTRDGRQIPIEDSAAPIRDDAGNLVGAVLVFHDTTEKRRAQEALRASEERLRLFIEHAPASLAMFDRQMRYLSVSSRWLSDYNLKERNIIGLSHYEVFPEITDYWKEVHRRGLAGEIVRADDDRFERADGSVQWLRWEVLPWRNAADEVAGIVIFTEDVTERKLAELELRESQSRLDLALRSAHMGAWRWDIIENRRWFDDEVCHLLGIDPAKFTGAAEEFFDAVYPEDRSSVREALARALQQDGFYETEYRVVSPEKGFRYIAARGRVVNDDHGRAVRLNGVIWDTTERKLMEEELRRSRDELERRVQERTAELNATISRLEQLNQELRDFAFVAAHDLQEPLRKIQTFCDLTMRRCASALDGASMDYLDRVIDSAERMRQLLRDLLEFSRAAMRPEPFQKLDLGEIAREAADVFEERAKETGCLIEIEDLPTLEVDRSQILQLFQNLIGNALKYHRGESPRVRIYGRLHEQEACEIFVEDNGIGFDPKFSELIFKPFQRLHGRGEYDGTGMGLAICRKIVERHGGTVRVESEPGKGSTFVIRLPEKQARLGDTIAG